LLLREADDEMLAEKPPPSAWRPGITVALLAAGIAALAGFAVVYVTLGRPDNAVQSAMPAPAPSAPPSGTGVDPLSRGQMAAFIFRKSPEELPGVKFLDAEGKERTLAHWRGKVVLLNLWATWCLPCRKEMPALDRLQREMGSDTFQVVAVSVDRTGLPGAKKFLADTGAETLALYADPTARMGVTLRAAGLPATLLLDRQGREIGRLLGPAEWDGEDAKRLIGAAMK
jgi:thiol-disulfide isomerase/thioredoxin